MSDLTDAEQENVRAALRYLRIRVGNSALLAHVLKVKAYTIKAVIAGREPVSARMVLRVARLVEIGLDSLLAGEYPLEGQCPHCGRVPVPGEQAPRGLLAALATAPPELGEGAVADDSEHEAGMNADADGEE